MAGYKVSYKILRQQGESMKAAAKLVDGYAERISQISGKLGDDHLLAEVRQNLQKMRTQLGESRTVLNTAGELLIKTVDNYTGTEVRQVKKVDGFKAHNRDFYKKPIVVASVGGAAGGVAVGAAASVTSTSTTTVNNYIDKSVNVTYAEPSAGAQDVSGAASAQTASAPAADAKTTVSPQSVTSARPTVSAQPTVNVPPKVDAAPLGGAGQTAPSTPQPQASGLGTVGVAAAGVLGGAAAAGGVVAGMKAKKRHDAQKAAAAERQTSREGYDPEAELKKALERLKELEREGG